MKRAKIMLVGICVLSVVGGALAFKANKAFDRTYCVRNVDDNSTTSCTDDIQNSKFVTNETQDIVTYYYTNLVGNCATISCNQTSDSFVAEN